ncbi:MAG: hypothetical protein R2854_30725 [Caldilineaceae bacterium]
MRDGRPVLGVINQPIINDFLIGTGSGAAQRQAGAYVHVRGLRMQSCSTPLKLERVRTTTPRPLTGSRRVNRYNNWGDCHGYFLRPPAAPTS